MRAIRSLLAHSLGATLRFLRWSLSAVEEDPERHVFPLPGPAHGPVPAIELRVERQRRRAS